LPLPSLRRSVTYAPKLGAHRVHVTVGRVTESGAIVEMWIHLHKTRAPLRGFGHALARLASLALQNGVPLATVVRALVGTDGGPRGNVADAPDGVTSAESVPDLVGQILDAAGRA
jgi:hypothetical protein